MSSVFVRSCHSALRLVGQEPEPSQATDTALACCFLGKDLGVGCHYFPPPLRHSNLRRQVPPRLHDARDPSSEGWNYGREYYPVIQLKLRIPRHLGIFYMPQICDMGQTAVLPPPPKEGALRIFFAIKMRRLRPGLNPANSSTRGQHAYP